MENSETKENWRLLRKHRTNLNVAGKAMLAFGIWTLLKLILELFLGEDSITELAHQITEESELVGAVLVVIIYILIGLIPLSIHYFIYRGARKESHGKKVGYTYLVISFLLGLMTVFSIIMTIRKPSAVEQGILSYCSSILFDLAIVICSIDVLYNGIQCKRLKKALRKQ